jgi:hypothetical protein
LALAAHSPMATLGVARSRVMLERESEAEAIRGRVRVARLDHETEVSIQEVPLAPHGEEVWFRAQAWGRVDAPVLAGEST